MQKILNKKTCEVIPYYYCLIYKTISEESNVTFSRHSNIVQLLTTQKQVYVDVKELLLLQANTSVQFASANHRRRSLCKLTMVVQNNFAIFQKFQVYVEQYRQSRAISSTVYGDKQLRIIETRKWL